MSGDRRSRALLERPVMRERFRNELRSRLMSEAAVVLAPRRRAPLFLFLRPALAAAAVAVLVLAGATGASASSLPGDFLYGVKRAGENVQVALTFDDLARMQLLSELADRRLGELAEVARQRPSAASTATAEYADAVERFADALDSLRDGDSDVKRNAAQALAEAARDKHKPVLEAVKEKISKDLQPAVQEVIEREHERANPGRGQGSTGGNRPAGQPTPRK
jgi:hypothetical protein